MNSIAAKLMLWMHFDTAILLCTNPRGKLYFKARGIKYKQITPLWPRVNGLTERFMQNIKCTRNLSKCNISKIKHHLITKVSNDITKGK